MTRTTGLGVRGAPVKPGAAAERWAAAPLLRQLHGGVRGRVPPRATASPPTSGTGEDPYVAAEDADAILVLTEWPVFSGLDWGLRQPVRSRGAVVLDTRNVLDRCALDTAKLVCLGNGTPHGY